MASFLELNEFYTILLHGKLPKSVSETVKHRCGDDWFIFDTFKKYMEEEIHNLRSFVATNVSKPGTLSTISTFTVNQSQSVRPKSKGNVKKDIWYAFVDYWTLVQNEPLSEGQRLRTYSIDLKARKKIALRGYLTSKPVNEYETVSVSIPYKSRLINMDCIVVDELPEYTKKFNVKRNLKTSCKTKICLADKDFDLPVDKQAPIDMLVGIDNVYNILHPGFRKAGKLILLPTIFGYVVTGSCNAPPVQETKVTVLKLATNEEVIEATHKFDRDIKNDLDILWNLDKVGIDCNELKEHDRKVLEDFESTIVYSEMEKQYVVVLSWKSNKSRLPSNFGMALGRVKQQSHHSVQKDSATTPIRIVFDCSWRQGKNGLSLNDCLWTGPHITTDLLKVLLQFRTNNYACISDIEKVFLLVQLREEDCNYTRFLWLQDPTDPNSELIIYWFRVVLLGATCSPFLLNATIKSHLAAVRKDTICTEMVDMMRRGLYVDNLQFTSNSEDELKNLFFGANKIFAQAHLYLEEWTSNSDLLNTVADAYRIKSEEKQTYKVLGLNWNISNDELTITHNHLKTGQTNREILSAIAQIYDPLGMLIPIMIRVRIFLQDLWKQQLKWDDLLSVPLLEQWNELSKDLGKSLSARLCEFIVETFEENKFEKIIIWSDSKVALGWLVTKNNLPVFVKNRVLEINSIITGIVFSYVPSSENPSDWITRGKRTEEVRNNSFWWEGPPWLKSENHTYPIDRISVKEAQAQDEVIQVHLVGNSEKTHLLKWERFSRVDKFCKTIAWIRQFIYNCKSTGCRKIGSLTLEELQQAKNKMIILLQKEYFLEEYKALEKEGKVSKWTLLVQLNLFLEEGIIRCRGRLEHVAQAAELKFPILLPKSCFPTKLIVREHHCLQAHMGVNATVASMRQEYWVPQLRQLSKSVIHHCIIRKYCSTIARIFGAEKTIL
ncbi:uncharacterized protein [Palaemon carinicauda]|uniref:uncharacterized protein n=1 Tax=Palaemon carinicauda TaxID=392227 RepID=UPI0035B601FC